MESVLTNAVSVPVIWMWRYVVLKNQNVQGSADTWQRSPDSQLVSSRVPRRLCIIAEEEKEQQARALLERNVLWKNNTVQCRSESQKQAPEWE